MTYKQQIVNKIFYWVLLIISLHTVHAFDFTAEKLPNYTGVIAPKVKKTLSEYYIFLTSSQNVTILTSEKTVKSLPLAVKMLKERIRLYGENTDGKDKVNIYIAKYDSPLLEKFNISDKPVEKYGYAIKVIKRKTGADIIAAGKDNRGVFYAAMSILQMIGREKNKLILKCADIHDYPTWTNVIAGDYSPVTDKKVLAALKFKVGGLSYLNINNWRNLPVRFVEKEHCLAQMLYGTPKRFEKYNVIDFMLITNIYYSDKNSPPLNIASEKEIKALEERLLLAAENGINKIMIAVDDHTNMKNGRYICHYKEEVDKFNDSVGLAHGFLLKRLSGTLQSRFPDLQLLFCPAPYSLKQHNCSSPEISRYFEDLRKMLPKEVPVLWTGPRIISSQIQKSDQESFKNLLAGNSTFLWDNSAAYDLPIIRWNTKLYPGMGKETGGVFLNSKMFTGSVWTYLYTLNACGYTWNQEAYNCSNEYRVLFNKICDFDYDNVLKFESYFLEASKCNNKKEARKLFDKCMVQSAKMRKSGLITEYTRNRIDLLKNRIFSETRVASIPLLSGKAPEINGDLDEPFWTNAREVNFLTRYGKEISPEYKTKAKIAFDNEAIYFAFSLRCGEYDYKSLKDKSNGIETKVFTSPDLVELFFQSEPGAVYAQLAVDCFGNKYDRLDGIHPDKWDIPYKAAVKCHKGEWTLELKIPFQSLNELGLKRPQNGTTWRVNFCREANLLNELQCFSPTYKNDFLDTQMFGKLEFKE